MLTQDVDLSDVSPKKVVAALAFALGIVLVLAWPVLVSLIEAPTLAERAHELRSIEPWDLRGVDFLEWSGPERSKLGPRVTANYDGPGAEGGFELTLAYEGGAAKARFASEKMALSPLTELQQINTFAPSEYCADEQGTIRCIGYLGGDRNLFLESWATGADVEDFDDSLATLLLLRTARKHIFRV